MVLTKKQKRKYGSLAVSTLFGAGLGFHFISLLQGLFFAGLATNRNIWIAVIAGSIATLLFALKNPRVTESASFLWSGFVFLQILWDGGAEPVFGEWRTIMSYLALALFFLNGFTGYLRIPAGIKRLRRALGGR